MQREGKARAAKSGFSYFFGLYGGISCRHACKKIPAAVVARAKGARGFVRARVNKEIKNVLSIVHLGNNFIGKNTKLLAFV